MKSPIRYLLQRVTPERFISHYWGQRPLHVRGRNRDFSTLLQAPWRDTRAHSGHIRAGGLGNDRKYRSTDIA
ncbi:MAG: hypothetical protein ACXW2D_15810, partial [Burkholderiaceae bacterium]